jgi:phosphoglycolate phosphatase
MNAGPVPLVVFDLDGTLIDSLADLCVAINRLVTGYGGRVLSSDDVARMVGEGAGILVSRALAASGAQISMADALPQYLRIYDSLLPGQTRPYPGIPEVLEDAGQVARLAVLTNKPTEATRKILDMLGLAGHFAEILGGDGPFRRKPHPDGLLHLADAAGIDAPSVLLVGDSSVDLRTAQAAGTRVCIARYGFGQANFDEALLRGDELSVDNPSELRGIVRGQAA